MAESTPREACNSVDERVDLLEREQDLQQKKLKKWQALALAAITAAGGALVGVAKGVYASGDKEGAARVTIERMQIDIERNRVDLKELWDYVTRSRHRELNFQEKNQ